MRPSNAVRTEEAVRLLLVSSGIPCRVTHLLEEKTDGLVEIEGTTFHVQVGETYLCVGEEIGPCQVKIHASNVMAVDLVDTIRRAIWARFATQPR